MGGDWRGPELVTTAEFNEKLGVSSVFIAIA